MKTCEQLKDKNKEKDVVTQSIKSKKARYLEALRDMVCLDSSKKPLNSNQYVTRQLS